MCVPTPTRIRSSAKGAQKTMSSANRIRTRLSRKAALAIVGGLIACVALTAWASGSSAYGQASALGAPPPEWAANAGAWPAHNYDLSNTRATTQTPINAQTVSKLKVKWRFAFKGASAFGAFASNPIVLNGTIYLQDLNSNVYALDHSTGKVEWERALNKPSLGPNGSSRPGANLYTNSLVALDGKTGKLLWFRQAVPHDIHDYDLMIPAIITTLPLNGAQTEIVLVAGKMGKAYAYRADDGKHLWTRSVGKHQNDIGPLPLRKSVESFPGDLGGVETPMALADGRLFVPWLDLGSRATGKGLVGSSNFNLGRGGLTAVDATSGRVLWERKLPSIDLGAATVANDVVFTSTYAGRVYALDTKTGKTLWTTKAPAGINSFPAIDGDTLLVSAATTASYKNPHFELIAYSLS